MEEATEISSESVMYQYISLVYRLGSFRNDEEADQPGADPQRSHKGGGGIQEDNKAAFTRLCTILRTYQQNVDKSRTRSNIPIPRLSS